MFIAFIHALWQMKERKYEIKYKFLYKTNTENVSVAEGKQNDDDYLLSFRRRNVSFLKYSFIIIAVLHISMREAFTIPFSSSFVDVLVRMFMERISIFR